MDLKLIALTCLTLLCSSIIYAQDTLVVQDLETWAGFEIEKQLFDKKLELYLTEEFRFNNNSSEIKEFFTEGGFNYKLVKDLKLGAGYRFTKQNKYEDGFVSQHRFHCDLTYKYKIDRFSLNSRLRFQSSNDTWFDETVTEYSMNKFRLKLTGAYNIKAWKLDPYLSTEIFYFSSSDNVPFIDDEYSDIYKQKGFEKLRLTAGTKYKLKDFGRFKFFLRYEQEFGNYANSYDIPERYYIIGLNYKFSF